MSVAVNDRMFVDNKLEGMVPRAVSVQFAAVPVYV
jgi:hypothetical protein